MILKHTSCSKLSKKSLRIQVFESLEAYAMGMSVSSLHRESTNSLIQAWVPVLKARCPVSYFVVSVCVGVCSGLIGQFLSVASCTHV